MLLSAQGVFTRRWELLGGSRGIVVRLGSLLVPVLIGGSAGGFFPTAWGWTGVVGFWLAATVLIVARPIELRAAELVYLGLLAGFVAWSVASVAWSSSVPTSMHDVQRNLAYLGVLAAAALLVRKEDVRPALGALCAGLVAVCVYGLLTRLLPERFGHFNSTSFDYRLAEPITYWNGLGIVGVMGVLLALGFAARGASPIVRALAAGSIPLLATTVYFTFSRGSLYAAGFGFLVAVIVERRRLQLLIVSGALAPFVAVAIAESHDRKALVTVGSTLADAQADGRGLLPRLLLLAAGAALAATAIWFYERRVRTPPNVRVAASVAVALLIVAGVVVAFARIGTPTHTAKTMWRSFHGSPSNRGANGDVSARFLSLSSNGRVSLWRVSLRRFDAHQVAGTGAGTFWESWARYRDLKGDTNQAHSLYFGVLGELGLVGLVLLGSGLLVPLFVGVVRGSSSISVGVGAFAAWVAHAGVDWDWSLIGVSLPGLVCGLLAIKGLGRGTLAARRNTRTVAVVACVGLAGAVGVILVSDIELSRGDRLSQTDPAAALVAARHARWTAPWSSEPYVVMAKAYVRQGRRPEAVGALRSAIDRDPSSWMLWRMLLQYGGTQARTEAKLKLAVLNPLGGTGACNRCGFDP